MILHAKNKCVSRWNYPSFNQSSSAPFGSRKTDLAQCWNRFSIFNELEAGHSDVANGGDTGSGEKLLRHVEN